MKWTIGIDPGKHKTACSYFANRLLIATSYGERDARQPILPFPGGEPVEVVLEFPRVYTAGKQKGDPNDLMELAAVVGWFEARAELAGYTHRRVAPREWKGTIDPDVMIERIKSRLTPEETKRVTLPSAKSLHHNVWDAIGIGLWALGRLEPRKVYPR